jgi:hypothetical protein
MKPLGPAERAAVKRVLRAFRVWWIPELRSSSLGEDAALNELLDAAEELAKITDKAT